MKLPAVFQGFASKADGSASLRFSTQEVSSADFANFKEQLNSFGWLVYEPEQANISVPKEKITDTRKKPSERLRAVIYLYGKQKGVEDADFNRFYETQMEHIIDKYKERLDD